MRGVPSPSLRHLHGSWRIWREGDGLAVVLAGAAAGYGGDRRRPVTGVAVRGSRRAVGLASEGRGESCRPATARPPGEPQPPTGGSPWPLFPSQLLAPVLAVHGPGPSGPARRRCALDDREENPHSIDMTAVGSSRRRPGYGYSGQSNRAQMVRLVWSPSIPHSSATARTMSRPWCRVGSIIPWFQGPPLSSTSIRVY